MTSSSDDAPSHTSLPLWLSDYFVCATTLTSIIVRWYHWVFKKIEDVVTAFYQTLFDRFKLLAKIADIQFEQVV